MDKSIHTRMTLMPASSRHRTSLPLMSSSDDGMILIHSWCSCVRLDGLEVLVHVYSNQDLSEQLELWAASGKEARDTRVRR
jgi:hypothetical protein